MSNDVRTLKVSSRHIVAPMGLRGVCLSEIDMRREHAKRELAHMLASELLAKKMVRIDERLIEGAGYPGLSVEVSLELKVAA